MPTITGRNSRLCRTSATGAALLLLAASGVAAADQACLPDECLNPATTDNGRFTIEPLGTASDGSFITFTYSVCQNRDAGREALSHWSIGLLQIDCFADGFGMPDLVVAATLDGEPKIFEVGLDPTTGVAGVKFDEGVEDDGCHVWSVTFDKSVLAANFTLVPGCVQASTKSGRVENNGHACILGPVCVDPPRSSCWAGETAWGAGPRYTPRGNWAMYTPYSGRRDRDALRRADHDRRHHRVLRRDRWDGRDPDRACGVLPLRSS